MLISFIPKYNYIFLKFQQVLLISELFVVQEIQFCSPA